MRERSSLLAFALLALACGREHRSGGCDVFHDASCLDVDRMVADVETLAGPAMAGRRAGFPGNAAAADFVEARFEALGLGPAGGAASRRQPFELEVWEATQPPMLRIGDLQLTVGDGDGLDVFQRSPSASLVGAPVVFAGYGTNVPPYARSQYPDCPVPESGYDDFAPLGDLTGRVVVLLRDVSAFDVPWFERCPRPQPPFAAPAAKALGAAAVLYAVPVQATEPRPFEYSATTSVPTLRISREVLEGVFPGEREWEAEIEAGFPASQAPPGLTADLELHAAVDVRRPENVLAVIPGSDPVLRDEVVVIGAHFDHLGQVPFRAAYYAGADDNASGTAVLLELARAVAASPTKPKRTLLFAAWNAEEWWMVGSYAYVAAPLVPLEKTVAAFAIDMVGDGDPGLRVSQSHPGLAATLESGRAALGLPGWLVTTYGMWGNDHQPFVESGLPGAHFITPRSAPSAYHTLADVPQAIDRETLGAAAKLAWAAIRQYALGLEEPLGSAGAASAATEGAGFTATRAAPAVR